MINKIVKNRFFIMGLVLLSLIGLKHFDYDIAPRELIDILIVLGIIDVAANKK